MGERIKKLLILGLFGVVTCAFLFYLKTEIAIDIQGIYMSITQITPSWSWIEEYGTFNDSHMVAYSLLFQLKALFIIILFWTFFRPNIKKIVELYILTILFYFGFFVIVPVGIPNGQSFFVWGMNVINLYHVISLSLLGMIMSCFLLPSSDIKSSGKVFLLVIIADVISSLGTTKKVLTLLKPIISLGYGQMIFLVLAVFILWKMRSKSIGTLATVSQKRFLTFLPWIYAFIFFGAVFLEYRVFRDKFNDYFFSGFLSGYLIAFSIGLIDRPNFHRRFLIIFLAFVGGCTLFSIVTNYSTPLTPVLNILMQDTEMLPSNGSIFLAEFCYGSTLNDSVLIGLWRWPLAMVISVVSNLLFCIVILAPYYTKRKLFRLSSFLVSINIGIGLLYFNFPYLYGYKFVDIDLVAFQQDLDPSLFFPSVNMFIMAFTGYILSKAEIQHHRG